MGIQLNQCVHVCLSVQLSVCMSVGLSVGPSVRPSVRLSVRRCVCLSVCLSVCMSVCMCTCVHVCVYVCLYMITSLCPCSVNIRRHPEMHGYIDTNTIMSHLFITHPYTNNRHAHNMHTHNLATCVQIFNSIHMSPFCQRCSQLSVVLSVCHRHTGTGEDTSGTNPRETSDHLFVSG